MKLSLILTLALAISASFSNAQVYVDADATGSNDGSSWTNAFNTMTQAVLSAGIGAEIWVAEGTYYSDYGTGSQTAAILPNSGQTILGGFTGNETSADQRDWKLHQVVISGDIGVVGDESDNSRNLMIIDPLFDQAVVIDGLVFRDAWGNSSTEGGAINVDHDGSTTIRNCVFINNRQTAGGAIGVDSNISGPVYIDRCEFIDNKANNGSAIYTRKAAYVTNSLFHGNETEQSFGSIVFGYTATGGLLDIRNCTFAENLLYSGTTASLISPLSTVPNSVKIYNCVFWNNQLGLDNLLFPDDPDIVVTHSVLQADHSNAIDCITADPQFVDPANGDYSVSESSPALEMGDNDELFTSFDFIGNPRIINGIVDAGAFERKTFSNLICVDQNASGLGNGWSWFDAYTDLQIAMNNVQSGQAIWVKTGTYYPTSGNNVNAAFELSTSGVEIYGGFNGDETDTGQRDLDGNHTVISGDINDPGEPQDNSHVLLFIEDSGDIKIDGFVFEKSFRDPSDDSVYRGALLSSSSDFTVQNCIFRENIGFIEPVARLTDGSFARFENCLMTNNLAEEGFLVSGFDGASAEVVNCTITQNELGGPVFGFESGFSLGIRNSIVWESPSRDVTYGGANASANNCLLSNTDNLSAQINVWGFEPNFVNPNAGDFRVSAGSIAYDHSDQNFITSNTDINGYPRFNDTGADVGAFEMLECEQEHDLCQDAILLSMDGNAIYGSNHCASHTAGEETNCFVNNGSSVWYSFVAPSSGSAMVTSTWEGKFSSVFNLRQVVYKGVCTDLEVIACDNDNTGGFGEETSVEGLEPGEIYFVKIDGYAAQNGRFTIRVESVAGDCPADLDSDQQVGTGDLLIFLSSYGQFCSCQADFDGDGQVAAGDLLILLAAYGMAC